MTDNSPAFNRQIKRNSTIFLAAVVAANVGYWGWRWATPETYEACLKEAARSANGVHRAYADLRAICAARDTARLAENTPSRSALPTPPPGLFDDLPTAKPPDR